jgi:hypothetical protein
MSLSGDDELRIFLLQNSTDFYTAFPQVKRCKAIPITGRGGLWGYETSRLPHCLDNRLADGGKVVSLERRPAAFTPY